MNRWKAGEPDFGDYSIEIEPEGSAVITGKIIPCHGARWLLLINWHFYGFYTSVREAKNKFNKTFPQDKKT